MLRPLLMLGGIAQDGTLPLTVRVRLWLLLFYLALPYAFVTAGLMSENSGTRAEREMVELDCIRRECH